MGENGQNLNSQVSTLKSQVSTLKSQIDWDEIRQRIAAMSQTLGGGDHETPELLQQVWARRAERIARAAAEQDEGEQVELVTVKMGEELYGLEAQYVFDIRLLEPRSLTRVPRAPGWVAGVVNWRGRILSVCDLPRFWGLPVGQIANLSYLVVVETAEMELALLANEVQSVDTVPVSKIQEAVAGKGVHLEYVRGIADRGENGAGGLLTILNLPALLADKQFVVHEEIS